MLTRLRLRADGSTPGTLRSSAPGAPTMLTRLRLRADGSTPGTLRSSAPGAPAMLTRLRLRVGCRSVVNENPRLMLPAKEHGPVRAIGTRVFLAAMCIVITTVVVYLERADYRDLDGTVDTWLDALYYATVTLSTTGYGDITPVTEGARLTNIVVITPLRFIL